MDIERLKELKQQVFDSFQLYEVKMQNNFDESMKTATPTGEMDDDGKDLTALIDEAIARQSATSAEVAEAISWAQGMEILYEEKQMPECADCAKTAIVALQQYQPNVSKTETDGCEWCDNGIDTASVMSADMMMRFVRPVNFCPNCGRRLEEKA